MRFTAHGRETPPHARPWKTTPWTTTKPCLCLSTLALLLVFTFTLAGCVQLSPAFRKSSEIERARMLFEHGELFEAREKALAVPRSSPEAKNAAALLTEINDILSRIAREHTAMAQIYYKHDIYPLAIEEYKTALKYAPNDRHIQNRIAFVTSILEAGARKPNHATSSKKLLSSTELSTASLIKSKAYLEAEDYARAIEELRAALKFAPDNKEAKELLAVAIISRDGAVIKHIKKGMEYFQAEEMTLAIDEWDLALELDPGNKTALDYRTRAKTILEKLEKIKDRSDKQWKKH